MLVKFKKRLSEFLLPVLAKWNGTGAAECSEEKIEGITPLIKEKLEGFVTQLKFLEAEYARIRRKPHSTLSVSVRERLQRSIEERFRVLRNNIFFANNLARCKIADICTICNGLDERFYLISVFLGELGKELLQLEFSHNIVIQASSAYVS